MDKKETAMLLRDINQFFPGKVKLEPATVEAWHRVMCSQDYSRAVKRLDQYVMLHKFPPTVHDLFERVRPEFNREMLSELDEWEVMSCGAPGEY